MSFGDKLWQLYRPLMSEALKLCDGNRSDAQDIVQAAMLKCLENQEKFKEGTNLYAWAVTILKNHRIDLIRKKTPDFVDPETLKEHAETNEDHPDKKEKDSILKLSIQRCLDSLNETRRSVLILNAQGQTAREISELLGFSINTALSHLARAKKSFGACIDSEGEYA